MSVFVGAAGVKGFPQLSVTVGGVGSTASAKLSIVSTPFAGKIKGVKSIV